MCYCRLRGFGMKERKEVMLNVWITENTFLIKESTSGRKRSSFSYRARQKSMFSHSSWRRTKKETRETKVFMFKVNPSASDELNRSRDATTGHVGREPLRGRLMAKGELERPGWVRRTRAKNVGTWRAGMRTGWNIPRLWRTFIQRKVCHHKHWNVLWESEDPPHCFNFRPFWNKAEKRFARRWFWHWKWAPRFLYSAFSRRQFPSELTLLSAQLIGRNDAEILILGTERGTRK